MAMPAMRTSATASACARMSWASGCAGAPRSAASTGRAKGAPPPPNSTARRRPSPGCAGFAAAHLRFAGEQRIERYEREQLAESHVDQALLRWTLGFGRPSLSASSDKPARPPASAIASSSSKARCTEWMPAVEQAARVSSEEPALCNADLSDSNPWTLVEPTNSYRDIRVIA
jgi:hypothetical protein